MAKIYRATDRITIKIHDMTVKIAPLTLQQKSEVMAKMMEGQKKVDPQLMSEGILLALSYCLKDVDGIETADGEKYQLAFENGQLTQACVEELGNMEYSSELLNACGKFLTGVPSKIDIEGVEILSKN